jgi:hypothetical protein
MLQVSPVRGEDVLIVRARVGGSLIGMMEQPEAGQRRFNAISSALFVRWRSLTALIAQPTTNREYRSKMTAR